MFLQELVPVAVTERETPNLHWHNHPWGLAAAFVFLPCIASQKQKFWLEGWFSDLQVEALAGEVMMQLAMHPSMLLPRL